MENRSVNLSKVLPRRLTNTLDDIWLFVYTEYLMHVPRRLRHLGFLRSFLQKLESKPNTQCCKPSSEIADPHDFYHALNNKTNNVQQFCIEPYILQGYALSNMPLRYYVKLLVVPTNELLNVWTHLVPCMWFMWMLAEYNQTLDLLQSWPVLITIVSAIIMTLFSSLAHLFHTRIKL
uniref:Uncharacterized protein n=1 Tax=Ciona savignyi TaxID=51511 RepID=H2ZCX1_CIOSA